MNELKIFQYIEAQKELPWLDKKLKKHFKDFQRLKLYSRFGKISVDEVWENFRKISQRFIIDYPSIFYFDKHITPHYKEIYLSAQIIRRNPEISERLIERGLDDIQHYGFFDTEQFKSGKRDIKINKIFLDHSYKTEAVRINDSMKMEACGIGELFSVIAANIESPMADISNEEILNSLLVKSESKRNLKDKYMKTFDKMFTQIGINKIKSAEDFHRSYKSMSLPIWEKEVALIFSKILEGKKIKDLTKDEIIWHLIKIKIASYSNLESKIRHAYKDFFAHLYVSSFPFQISSEIIINKINSMIINESIKILKGEKLLSPIKEYTKKYNYRTRYIKAGNKTKLMLKEASLVSLFFETVTNHNELKSSMLDIYLLMIEKGINDNEIRNMFKKIYDLDKFFINGTVSRAFHDVSLVYLPSLSRLLSDMEKDNKYKKFNNKIIKLLVSELNSDQIKTQTIQALSSIDGKKINLQYDTDFNSLNELIGLCSFDENDKEYAKEKIKELNLKFHENDDNFEEKVISMKMGANLEKIFSNYKKERNNTLLQKPLIKDIGRGLKAGLFPHNHAISLLAVGVNGVCISPGSKYHAQQHRKECVNLIIYDDKGIYLWGLMVKAEQPYHWFLNNFQGRIPSRYEKGKDLIRKTSLELMSSIGDVFMKRHSFNSISIHTGLEKVNIELMKLPKMRLDTYQDNDGSIRNTEMYKLPKIHNGLNLIK